MNMKNQRSSSFLRPLAGLLLACALLLQTGCVAVVAAGAAGTGVAWHSGRMETTLNHELDAVYAAAQKAVDKLEFARVSEKKSGVDAELIARTARDKKVEITLKRVDGKITRLGIRVGVFGDEALSLTLLEQIKAQL